MYSKAKIFNLALGALLLSRQITDTETDKSNEAKVLNTHWDSALQSTLEDLDLDSTSETVTLELITLNPTNMWGYAYKYPTNCAFFRRVCSYVDVDNRSSYIAKRVGILNGQKVVFTNREEALAEVIPVDVPIDSLNATTALCIAYRLASLCAPLVTGKGAKGLMDTIEKRYLMLRAQAQKQDQLENFNFEDPEVESEFVEARMS